MYRTIYSQFVTAAALCACGAAGLQAQDVELNPGFITGTVQVGSELIQRVSINAGASGGLSSSITIRPPAPGETEVAYSLTVDVPSGTTPTYNVSAFVEVDGFADDLSFPAQQVSVAEGATVSQDFILANPGYLEGTVTVTDGGRLSSLDIRGQPLGISSIFARTFISAGGGTSASYRFPVQPHSSVGCSGFVRLTNNAFVSLPQQSVTVAPGGATTCDFEVETPQSGAISGTIDHSGSLTPDRYIVFASGPSSRSTSLFQPFDGPGNREPFNLSELAIGGYNLSSGTQAIYNGSDDNFRFPSSAFSPSTSVNVGAGSTTSASIAACQAYLNGTLTITGSAALDDLSSGSSTVTAAGIGTPAAGGTSLDRIDVNSGAYDLVLSDGEWRADSYNLRFIRPPGDPDGYLNQTLSLTDYEARNNPVLLACGQTAAADRQLSFGGVTVNFSVAGGGVLSNPQLFGSCQLRDESNNLVYFSSLNSSSTGQIDVEQGAVTFLSHGGTCSITARATVNGAFVTFSQFQVDVVPGVDQEIDIGGPSVVVTFPEPGICIDADTVTVTGRATDDVEVAELVVNGVAASLVSTGNVDDPAEVSFSATIPLPNKGPVTITTVATDTSGKTSTDTRTVFNDSGPPLVAFTPENGAVFNLPATSTIVAGSVRDDAGVASVAVNGVVVGTVPGAPGEVTFSTSVPLALGDNTITVVGTDISEKSTTVTHVVTLVENQPPSVSLSGPTEIGEGSTPSYSFTVTDPDDTTFSVLSASCGAAGTSADLVSDDSVPGGGTFSCTFPDGPASSNVSVQVADAFGATASTTLAVEVVNIAPAPLIQPLSSSAIDEGETVSITVVFTDPGTQDTHGALIDWGDGGAQEAVSVSPGARTFTATHSYPDDNPTATPSDSITIGVSMTDSDGAPGSTSAAATVNNLAPTMGAISGVLDPVPVGTIVSLSAAFEDLGVQDTHVCTVDWDDPAAPGDQPGTVASGSCDVSRHFSAPGVYSVVFTVTDDDTEIAVSDPVLVVVFDPSAGFVTGGGWINSPPGAYPADPELEGKANFGFVAKYKKGQSTPDGQTEFQFKAGGLNFHSSSYEWLVVAGTKAQFKGEGAINGAGHYGFLLTAEDGDSAPSGPAPDRFRIKIWDKAASDAVVYDNKIGASDDPDAPDAELTVLGGGSIVIHGEKGGKK